MAVRRWLGEYKGKESTGIITERERSHVEYERNWYKCGLMMTMMKGDELYDAGYA